MAKESTYPAVTPVATDYIRGVDDPAGTPATVNYTLEDLLSTLSSIGTDGSGNVGIGTTTPAGKLEVINDQGSMILRADASAIDLTRPGMNYIRATDPNGSLGFEVGGGAYSPQVVIEATGDLWLNGTLNPAIILESTAGAGVLKFNDSGATEWALGISENGGLDRQNLTFLENGSSSFPRVTFEAGGNVGIGTASPSAKLDIDSDILRVRTAKTPASATDTGNAGDWCWDSDYIYICVAANTWKRAALGTW